MSEGPSEPEARRPVLLGQVTSSSAIPPRRGGGGRVVFHNTEVRASRLDGAFVAVESIFGDQIQLAQSLQAADPQLVLVFEGVDEQVDLAGVAARLGIEPILDAESDMDQTDEFALASQAPRNPRIATCLHAVCLTQQAYIKILRLWRAYRSNQHLGRGLSPLRDLFDHLRDVRPWGPQDRLKMIDWEERFAGSLATTYPIEVELWFRESTQARWVAEDQVRALVVAAGGQVTRQAVVTSIGYHALKCEVPVDLLRALVAGRYDDVQLVKSTNVMYLRVSGQSVTHESAATGVDVTAIASPPAHPAVACLLDGVPVVNHPLLDGRVEVFDPDDLASESTVIQRKHGTWMASIAVWGDRSAGAAPAAHMLLVRPILTPALDTANETEELPANELAPDLMWRVVRELLDGAPGIPPAAPLISIINLSVGDPASMFDTIMSSWSRMLDWLSYEYGLLFVVSAGNHGALPLGPVNSDQIRALSADDRRQAILQAQARDLNGRRLLAPAESVNSITVGAVHDDASAAGSVPYTLDPADGLTSISPISAAGSGYRRSIKPDLAASGGRILFSDPVGLSDVLVARETSPLGPGIKVASAGTRQETYIGGTSAAAAMTTSQLIKLHALVDQITVGHPISRRQRVSALKTLLVHGVSELPGFQTGHLSVESLLGNGVLLRDLSEGCVRSEAVLLYLGAIGAREEQELLLPLPDGLSVRETKRIEATLAWLTPINWKHRQYRRAALSFTKPAGAIPNLGTPVGLSRDDASRGATTVQHQVWETPSAFASGRGWELVVKVKCYEQAGGLSGDRVDYAAVLSLWVAPVLGVDVYSQVRDQIRVGVPVRP